jgi:hypothetical protein
LTEQALDNAIFTEAVMKVITIFALALLVASSVSAAQVGGAARVTSKPVDKFVSCFVAGQQRASSPWWFVPKDHGGTISNLGANDGRSAYFLAVSDLGSRREVALTMASERMPLDRAVVRAVDQCI